MYKIRFKLLIIIFATNSYFLIHIYTQNPKIKLTKIKTHILESFNFIQITDTHIGEVLKNRDYGSPGFLTLSIIIWAGTR